MIPLLLIGLTVLVLASMTSGDRRQASGAGPVVPPPPPRPGSTVVYAPGSFMEAATRQIPLSADELRREQQILDDEYAESARERQNRLAESARLLREANEALARNQTELDMIEEDFRRSR